MVNWQPMPAGPMTPPLPFCRLSTKYERGTGIFFAEARRKIIPVHNRFDNFSTTDYNLSVVDNWQASMERGVAPQIAFTSLALHKLQNDSWGRLREVSKG